MSAKDIEPNQLGVNWVIPTLITVIGGFMSILDSSIVNVAIPPMQSAAMTALPPELVSRGSAINNIISRVASSFGLAILTVFVTDRTTLHSAYIGWNVSGQALNDLVTQGIVGQQTVSTLLGGLIYQISFVKALNEMFLLTTILSLILILPSLLFKKVQPPVHSASIGSTTE